MNATWEPHDEASWKDLINHLDEELEDLQDTLHIQDEDITMTHEFNLGCKWIIKVDADASFAATAASGYKHAFMDGPADTDMTADLNEAVYAPRPLVMHAGMKSFIRELRGRLVSSTGWTPTIASFLNLAGPEDIFSPLTYKPKVKVTPTTGNIRIKVSGIKHLQGHYVYVRVVGATAWEKPIFFGGAELNLARVTTPASEALEIFLKGVIKNVEIGIESDTTTFGYKNNPPVTP